MNKDKKTDEEEILLPPYTSVDQHIIICHFQKNK